MTYEPMDNEEKPVDMRTVLMKSCEELVDGMIANPTVGFAKMQNEQFEVLILRLK